MDKEQVKELLYVELELSRELEQIIGRLKKAARDLKALGEALEREPFLLPLTPSGCAENKENRHCINMLVECSQAYSFTRILAELVNLRSKRELLAEVQNTLALVRNLGQP